MHVVLRCAKNTKGKPTTFGLTLERRVESGTNVTSVLIKGLDVGSANEGVLQRGDELIAIGGVRVQGNYEAVIQQLTKYKPADGVDAEIVRKPYVPIAAPLAAPLAIAPVSAADSNFLASAMRPSLVMADSAHSCGPNFDSITPTVAAPNAAMAFDLASASLAGSFRICLSRIEPM